MCVMIPSLTHLASSRNPLQHRFHTVCKKYAPVQDNLGDSPDALRELAIAFHIGAYVPRTPGTHVPHKICNGCQHAIEADQPALIAAERGDVPVVDLRFRCGACGSRNTSVIVSNSRTGRRD